MCWDCFGKGHSEEPPPSVCNKTPSPGHHAPVLSYPMNNKLKTQSQPHNIAAHLLDNSKEPSKYTGYEQNAKISTGATGETKSSTPRKPEDHQLHNYTLLPSRKDKKSNKAPKESPKKEVPDSKHGVMTDFDAQNDKMSTRSDEEHSEQSEDQHPSKKSTKNLRKQPPKEQLKESSKEQTRIDQPSSKLGECQLLPFNLKDDASCSDDDKKSHKEPQITRNKLETVDLCDRL